jgi:hypothetical protein
VRLAERFGGFDVHRGRSPPSGDDSGLAATGERVADKVDKITNSAVDAATASILRYWP